MKELREQSAGNQSSGGPTQTHSDPLKAGATNFAIAPPSVSLPKGGGAVRGIGEKFATNPVTGTGSMTVPIATSPGRSGFGPQLSLSYDSGSGNGPFGFGWSLSLPSITRKTDKGLPRYLDAEDSDVFILSGSEDLVPVYQQDSEGAWVRDAEGRLIVHEDEIDGYQVRRYRPRIEGLFARIERWASVTDSGDVHWRSISKDNVLTLYGRTSNSRISDPEDLHRIFSWLISETRDDKGNVVLYEYKAEDGTGVHLSRISERNRGDRDDPRRGVNRYIKRIRYGNVTPLLVNGERPRFVSEAEVPETDWMFEVIFDYGEHDDDAPTPAEGNTGRWAFRQDPFSTYRAGFEVRTTRLCQRVLMFHHFPGEDGIGPDCLVRSSDFTYSHELDPEHVRNPVYTFLRSVTQTGYKRQDSSYMKRSLPPVEFEYSLPVVQDTVEEVDAESLESLPAGVDGTSYRWTDLHGEGIPGILTEQADTWLYKRNLSPIADGEVEFAPFERVVTKPNLSLESGAQFMDLAGDGLPDIVPLGEPTPGLYEHDGKEGWQSFRPFTSRLNRDMRDPNMKFVDLNGDGHADVLISEDEVLVWHQSLAEAGFGPARQVAKVLDEEKGPRLIFADGTQSVYLADLSGDGLTDLMRIRNGEVCYWPNMGYGRFGAKITMDNAPHFDNLDQFDHRRVRLADIDGTGTNDIIYLHRDGVRLYFNQSGNGWSKPHILNVFPRIDEIVSIAPADVLGNGTACLVWSSPLLGDARRPMRYVNLMGGKKPHLLTRTRNNLGAETEVHYAPSTKFYLQDRRDGKPWITKLPFPVHVVEKVTVTDQWRKTRFATTYSYHHGFFDGHEREFRGFGRVDQTDVESFGEFTADNADSPYVADDKTLYQPPVKTVTWIQTGALIDRARILSRYEDEYFPNWFKRRGPGETNVLGAFREDALPEPDVDPSGPDEGDLSAEEWREAMRACKGMMLRQEVYELDVDALEDGEERPVKLFSAAYHNCHIRRLQPRAENGHAVFLVTESEAITYHYEMDLRPETFTPDPRIAHTLNLRIDEYGNVLQSVAVVYPRAGRHSDETLRDGTEELIARVQGEVHLSYTETRYTNDVDDPTAPDQYRLRVPCEVLTYELTGVRPAGDYLTIEELRALKLSDVHQAVGAPVRERPYHQAVGGTGPEKRVVEHVRMLYFGDDLETPLPLGRLNARGLPFETYKLALTDELLTEVIGEARLTPEIRADLDDATLSGYLSGVDLDERFPDRDNTGQYWIRSGVGGFAPDAAHHFYLPERYTDPFGNVTALEYDGGYDLFVRSSTDPVGNTTTVMEFDYRVLAPREIRDVNDNLSEAAFDALGLPTAMAVKGKGTEGDRLSLTDELIHLDPTVRRAFFIPPLNETRARRLLGEATARTIYYFGEQFNPDGTVTYGTHPPCAAAIQREQHVAALQPGDESPLQLAFEYSDGGGNVLVKIVQAEPESDGSALRWISNGRTILNNKGKPVKQYEPYFTATHMFEDPKEEGVTPVMYYDAVGRLIRTELPDGSFSRVEFSPWHVTSYDPNDTVLESDWYRRRTEAAHPRFLDFNSPENRSAAELTAGHAHTPAQIFLDSLGREVVSIAHNSTRDRDGSWHQDKYVTFTKLDAEGKPLWIRDARRNLVMQYITPRKPVRAAEEPDPTDAETVPAGTVPCYDIAGNLLHQHSMDAASRWMITDAAGQPFYAWDENERVTDGGELSLLSLRLLHTTYDTLRRPLTQQLRIDDGEWQVVERLVYGEDLPDDRARNLRGQILHHYEPSGLVTNQRLDFKGNLLTVTRRIASAYGEPVIHWPEDPPDTDFGPETWARITEYDALNRMTRLYNWHRGEGSRVAVYEPSYNDRGLLRSEDLVIKATKMVPGYNEGSAAQRIPAIRHIAYNAKGQRTRIEYGNEAVTTYQYDPETFRLTNLKTTRPSGSSPLQHLWCTYDPSGNITEIRDHAQQTAYFDNTRVDPRCRYEYDALYRLTFARGREHAAQNSVLSDNQRFDPILSIPFPNSPEALQVYTERYAYDEVGNILSMAHSGNSASGWKRCYQYALDSNRLLATSRPGEPSGPGDSCPTHYVTAPTLSRIYDYDTHGNMLSVVRTPETYRFHWDHRDMIRTVNLGGGGWAYYNYDTEKKRTRKRIERNGGIVEDRFYFEGMELYRRSGGGRDLVEEIETHHLFADDQRILIVEDVLTTDNTNLGSQTLFRYQLGNHLGSACVELDEEAHVITYEEYHPYGTTAYRAGRRDVEAKLKRYRYTGMERDKETGLSYHMARYYALWLGRWCSADPAGLASGIQLNEYTQIYEYSNSNPIIVLDTSGHQGIVFADIREEREWRVGRYRPPTAIPGRPAEDPDLLEREFVATAHTESNDTSERRQTRQRLLNDLRQAWIRLYEVMAEWLREQGLDPSNLVEQGRREASYFKMRLNDRGQYALFVDIPENAGASRWLLDLLNLSQSQQTVYLGLDSRSGYDLRGAYGATSTSYVGDPDLEETRLSDTADVNKPIYIIIDRHRLDAARLRESAGGVLGRSSVDELRALEQEAVIHEFFAHAIPASQGRTRAEIAHTHSVDPHGASSRAPHLVTGRHSRADILHDYLKAVFSRERRDTHGQRYRRGYDWPIRALQF